MQSYPLLVDQGDQPKIECVSAVVRIRGTAGHQPRIEFGWPAVDWIWLLLILRGVAGVVRCFAVGFG